MFDCVLALSILLAFAASAHSQTAPDQPVQAPTQQISAPAAKSNGDVKESRKETHKPIASSAVHNPVLWQDPGDISSKNLLYGFGGEEDQPKPPFTFLDEDKNGSNPKFDVRDANGTKWRAKLGPEARPEVTASRLLWAIGYFTDIDYVVPQASVNGLRMHRGHSYIHDGEVDDARFARKPDHEKRVAAWAWKSNPFLGPASSTVFAS